MVCTVCTEMGACMSMDTSIGLEQARAGLPTLVEEARSGHSFVITRHGKPVAAVVPLSVMQGARKRAGLLALRGSGAGLWGGDAALAVRGLRDEWP